MQRQLLIIDPLEENTLREKLEGLGTDVSKFGAAKGAKTLRDLLHEIHDGVSELYLETIRDEGGDGGGGDGNDGRRRDANVSPAGTSSDLGLSRSSPQQLKTYQIVRRTMIISIAVLFDDHVLIERQRYEADGRVRALGTRNGGSGVQINSKVAIDTSEADWYRVAQEAVCRELRLSEEDFQLVEGSMEQVTEPPVDSPTYPGIPTVYVVLKCEARLLVDQMTDEARKRVGVSGGGACLALDPLRFHLRSKPCPCLC